MTDVDEFLAHYGIKGMRWGVTHPPDSTTGLISRSAAEKMQAKADKRAVKDAATTAKRTIKAAPFHAKAAEARASLADVEKNGMTSALMVNVYGKRAATCNPALFFLAYQKTKTKALDNAKKELNEKVAWADKNAAAAEQGKLTTAQKKAIIGASVGIGLAVATTGLAIYGAKKMGPIIAAQKLSETRGLTAEYGGGNISYDKFMTNMAKSKNASWGSAEHITRIGRTNLDDIDIHLPKGTQFTRISSQAESTFRAGNYATFLPEDVKRYRASFVNEKFGADLYNVKIDTLQDVRVPSLRKRVDTFIDVLNDPETGEANRKRVLGTIYNSVEKEKASKLSPTQLGEQYYHKVTGGNFEKDPLSKAFADRILKQGYNAIIDDMDAGVYGDKPMVLLDQAVFKVASSEPLTKQMIDDARATMTEVIGRKY